MTERLAVQGEVLVTYRFRTGWIGLASPMEIAASKQIGPGRSLWSSCMRLLELCFHPGQPCVVRVAPGTHLRVSAVPDQIAREFEVDAVQDVSFVRLNEVSCVHRDAIRFCNGRHVLLQRFEEGISFQVLADGSRDSQSDRDPLESFKLPAPESGSFAERCGKMG